MRNIRLALEYEGTHYCGWQTQGNARSSRSPRQKTIQETIEKALQGILQEKVRLIGSGRTDAGVHAGAQVANFKTTSCIPAGKLQKALNSLLPDDIVVTRLEEAEADFHSRFQAISKVYRYTILNRSYPSAFLRDRVYYYPYPLDVRLMRREAQVLVGRHDLKAFRAADKKERGSVRTVKSIMLARGRDGFLRIDIEADGFLYNMVRNIVGTLIEIGRGRFPAGSMKRILRSRDRGQAGPTAPAVGLCLEQVKYGEKRLEPGSG